MFHFHPEIHLQLWGLVTDVKDFHFSAYSGAAYRIMDCMWAQDILRLKASKRSLVMGQNKLDYILSQSTFVE